MTKRQRETYTGDAELHSLSVQFNGFIVVSLLIFFKGLRDQEVGALQVHLLPGLQRVVLLSLAWSQRNDRTHDRQLVNRLFNHKKMRSL